MGAMRGFAFLRLFFGLASPPRQVGSRRRPQRPPPGDAGSGRSAVGRGARCPAEGRLQTGPAW